MGEARALDPGGDDTGLSRDDLPPVTLISAHWRRVLARRAPLVTERLETSRGAPLPGGSETIPILQALNKRFQLEGIAGENASVRARRATETGDGAAAISQSFAALVPRTGQPERVAELAGATDARPGASRQSAPASTHAGRTSTVSTARRSAFRRKRGARGRRGGCRSRFARP